MKPPITDALLDELLKNYSQPGGLAAPNWPSALSHFAIEFEDLMSNNQ
jgi:hypothetical protein